MTEYDKNLPILPAFGSVKVEFPLARVVANAGLKQLHIAETVKYAHITYFLNGGREEPFKEEKRILVPSPNVPSYDQKPEMSAEEIKNYIIANLPGQDFIAANFANADMVGHTGNFNATVKALETLDACMGKLSKEILNAGGALIITADHGNAEEKIYRLSGEKKSMHSINPVPFYLITNEFKRKSPLSEEEIGANYQSVKGTLSDVAPTVLELLGLQKPASMTGKSLIEKLLPQLN